MKFIAALLLSVFVESASGQNLVPNPSFEAFERCPDEFFQIYRATPWFSPDCGTYFPDHGYAVYFNACNYTTTSVPNNVVCFQPAHSGAAYAGVEVVSAYGGVYRQYVETKLTTPLESGRRYYFSLYFNLCDQYPGQPDHVACFNADSTGVVFSTAKIDKNDKCLALPLTPDVHATLNRLAPSSDWHLLEGCYTAKGGEEYITIGNFGGEIVSNCAAINTLAYFIFVDDVSLIPEVKKTTDTTLCAAETWTVDATTFRNEYKTMTGWNYSWSNGDTTPVHRFNSAANEKLIVSRAGCMADEYSFNIKFDAECACKIFVPNAFTPNGDGLNDVFLPKVKCSTLTPFNYRLSLYNRWGERIFFTTDINKAWDGKYRKQAAGSEVFAWSITYDVKKGANSEHKSLSGTVAALR